MIVGRMDILLVFDLDVSWPTIWALIMLFSWIKSPIISYYYREINYYTREHPQNGICSHSPHSNLPHDVMVF